MPIINESDSACQVIEHEPFVLVSQSLLFNKTLTLAEKHFLYCLKLLALRRPYKNFDFRNGIKSDLDVGEWVYTLDTWAEKLDLSRATVKRVLKSLKDRGVIRIRKPNPGGPMAIKLCNFKGLDSNITDAYGLPNGGGQNEPPPQLKMSHPVGQNEPSNIYSTNADSNINSVMSLSGDNDCTNSIKSSSKKDSSKKPKPSTKLTRRRVKYTAEFNELCNKYLSYTGHRKNAASLGSKIDAWIVWQQMDDEEQEDAIFGVSGYVKSVGEEISTPHLSKALVEDRFSLFAQEARQNVASWVHLKAKPYYISQMVQNVIENNGEWDVRNGPPLGQPGCFWLVDDVEQYEVDRFEKAEKLLKSRYSPEQLQELTREYETLAEWKRNVEAGGPWKPFPFEWRRKCQGKG